MVNINVKYLSVKGFINFTRGKTMGKYGKVWEIMSNNLHCGILNMQQTYYASQRNENLRFFAEKYLSSSVAKKDTNRTF